MSHHTKGDTKMLGTIYDVPTDSWDDECREPNPRGTNDNANSQSFPAAHRTPVRRHGKLQTSTVKI